MKVTDSAGGGGRCIDEDDLFGDPKSWPPGFRFHPTDEELVLYYLKRKICRRRLKLNVIADVDVYKCDPEELPCKSVLKSGDRQWYFFSPRDRKYPNGGRSNRATGHGYWKATGKDRRIEWNSRIVGNKKTLVFYRGRAPSGERTDWVMHEYTMDEEEIKRCKYVQDSYALYKVYKKSGPGPKNGEQYGAPFREEEWADDCDPVGDKQDNQLQHVDRNVCGEKALINNQCQPEVDILDEILGFIADEPQINGEQEHGLEFLLPEVGEEVGNTRTGPTLGEAISPEPSVVLNPSHVQRDAPYSIGVAQSGVPDSPSNGIPEVTSGPNTYEQVADEPQEDNFLEMDDLTGPQPNFSDLKHVDDDLVFEDPDLYFDAAMFLHDMGPIDQGATSHPYYNFGGEMANHLDYHMQPSQLDYEFEPVTSQLWVHDQNPNICIPSKSNEEFMAPLDPGKFHEDGSSSNFISEERQNQDNNEAVDVNSWFSSPITALLGSVPTRPAFASENAIINRAFERMSSFSRARIPTVETDVARGTGVPEGRRNSGKNGGYLFLSILVAFCAVLWLLVIGTTVKVLKTFVGKFISS